MKKLFGIVICILLLVCALVPTIALAETPTAPTAAPTAETPAPTAASASNVTYFLNPTAIAVQGGKLFVADNIEAGKSVILCFDVSGAPQYLFTTEVDGDVVNLSAKEGGLYAVLKNEVIEYTIADAALDNPHSHQVAGAVNFVWGTFGTGMTEYYADSTNLKCNTGDEFGNIGLPGSSNRTLLDLLAINADEGNSYIYCLTESDGSSKLQRINGTKNGVTSNDDVVNNNLNIANSGALGLFEYTTDAGTSAPGFFGEHGVSYVDIAESSCSAVERMSYPNDSITDAAADATKLYILNGRHKVEIYERSAQGYSLQATIGTETLPGEVPEVGRLTAFTQVKCNGYPSNIVFKTEGEGSIAELIDDAAEYIVLGYEGENSDFYYVLVGDKFGWVKRSDGAASPLEDGKLTVVDTKMGNDDVTYKTFVSLGGVWVYPLPREAFKPATAFTQSATGRQDVTLLQRFTEGETAWYYVRYDGDKLGFVTAENIGHFYLDANLDGASVVGDRKANGKLFGFVQLYDNNDPETMDDAHRALNKEGEEIRHLGSGRRVTLVKEYDNGTALVQVVYGDGSTDTGYCFADRLIPVGALTTNAVFGLVVTGVAVALAVTLTLVFVTRRKNAAAAANDRPATPDGEE